MTKTLEETLEEIQKIDEHARKLFKDFIDLYFQKHPDLMEVRWTQWTPAFNDGDPCVMEMGEVYTLTQEEKIEVDLLTEEELENDFSGEEKYESFYCKTNSSQLLASGFCDALFSIPNEILTAMYGDGVEIILKRTENGSIELITNDYNCGY